MADPRDTPAMQQYYRFKRQHPGCVLMFRIGDFYEMFDDDAVNVSKAVGLTLTQRSAGVPLAGIPYHQLEVYLRKMIALGFRVAVCEQVEEASKAKGLVARAVTRVLTPGTLTDENLLEHDAPAALAAVCFTGEGEDSPASLAVVDLSTGAFTLCPCASTTIVDELARRGVRELLYAAAVDGKVPPRVQRLLTALSLSGTGRPSWQFRHAEALDALKAQFGVSTMAGFGISDQDPLLAPAGALVSYLAQTQTPSDVRGEPGVGGDAAGMNGTGAAHVRGQAPGRASLAHLRAPRRENPSDWCVIDAASLRALEIEGTLRGRGPGSSGSVDGSLLGAFLADGQGGRTAMGKRLLRDWLLRPLRDLAGIEARHAAVATLIDARESALRLGELLRRVQDVSRIAGRLALARATPRDLLALGLSLQTLEDVLGVLAHTPSLAPHREKLAGVREALTPLAAEIVATCVESPPVHLREGGLVRDGVDAELDEARGLERDAGAWLAKYQSDLSERHQLPGIKVGYNKIFGYYIELPAAQSRRAPAELSRKQTLKNAERYTTPELQDFESKVSTAQSRGLERERLIFESLCGKAGKLLPQIQTFAEELATLDVLLGFAEHALRRGWTRPSMTDEPILDIRQGRHPVLEQTLASSFVPNDLCLGTPKAGSLALITGPNMAGKSTFIRQTALIVLLAHAGSYVPAESATIGLTDRIFTRIGADDALHAGQSTFMVEMIEAANILHHATPRSLVVLDEIGRGTSTFDGLSLAWGIAEHLALHCCVSRGMDGGTGEPERIDAPRTLFATHYHELTDLAELYPGRVGNLQVEVREWPPGDPAAQIIFLHKISPGRADQSYGIHVARLAGIPGPVIARAREVLSSLVLQHTRADLRKKIPETGEDVALENGKGEPAHRSGRIQESPQLSLFTEYLRHPALDMIAELKIEQLSPIQAFDALRDLKRMLDEPPIT